jgi:hypothetical protein
MTKTVEKDYETVEKEVTKYKCDAEGCENIVEEDEINTAFFVKGDEHKARPYPEDIFERRHVCEACSGLRTALQIREDKKSKTEYFREWWSDTKIWLLLVLPSFLIGMTTMFFAYDSHLSTEDPIWALDLLMSFIFQAGLGLFATFIVLFILESQDKL